MRDLLSPLWTAQQPPVLSAPDWELLLIQARAARLGGRLAWHFEDKGWRDVVPPRCWLHLQSGQRYAGLLHRDVLVEIDHLAAALRGLDVPVVLLKGAAYVAAGLPPARGRLFSDVDILVPRARLKDTELALFAAGWIPEKLSAYDERYYRQWMHELPPLQHMQRRSYLDVHHTIAPPTSRFVIDGAALLAQAQPLPDAQGLHALAPAHMVLHSALHLMQEGDFTSGLRDLLDINDLLRHFGQDDTFWPGLAEQARALQLQRPLGHVLVQIDRLFGTRPPAQWAGMFPAPVGSSARWMRSLLALVLLPAHDSCASAGVRGARWLMYVRSHWLRMPWYQIAPHLMRKAWAGILERFAAKVAAPEVTPK